jgi:peptidoglycan/xylan/chitin deacetylase (PgdA/CDA1 family)
MRHLKRRFNGDGCIRKTALLIIIVLMGLYVVPESRTLGAIADGEINTSTECIMEYYNDIAIAVYYPVTGKGEIDRIVKARINTLIEDFKLEYENKCLQGNKYEDNPYKAELNIDYRTEEIEEGAYKLRLSICTKDYVSGTKQQHTESMTFDMQKEKLEEYASADWDGEVSRVEEWEKPELPNVRVRKLDPDKPMVALTFDDGPHRLYTVQILNSLKKNDSAATFFVVGNRVAESRDILKRMVAEGSEIGNHTWNHKQLTMLKDYEVEEQITMTQKAVYNVTGLYPQVMRPTYGSIDSNLQDSLNLPVILWSVDPLDWKTQNGETIAKKILDSTSSGDIVLMHDIFPSTAVAADIVVREFNKRGFQLVTINELLSFRENALQAGQVYRRR